MGGIAAAGAGAALLRGRGAPELPPDARHMSLDDPPAPVPVAEVAASPASRAVDPSTSQAELADIAYRHPELRAAVAANPSCYPALREWIVAAGDRAV